MLRWIEIQLYQLIANSYTRKLKKIKNQEQWNMIYKKAMEFNQYCIDKDIYLK